MPHYEQTNLATKRGDTLPFGITCYVLFVKSEIERDNETVTQLLIRFFSEEYTYRREENYLNKYRNK